MNTINKTQPAEISRDTGVMFFEWIVLLSLLVIGIIVGTALIRQIVGVRGQTAAHQLTNFNQTYLCKGTYIRTRLSNGSAEYASDSSFYEDGVTVNKTGHDFTIGGDIKRYYGWHPGTEQTDGEEATGGTGGGTQGTVPVPRTEYPDASTPTVDDNTNPNEETPTENGIYPTWKPTTPTLPGF